MCYSSQHGKSLGTSSSPSFKRRCVSMSSMTDIPTCPVVNGVLGGNEIHWKDDIVEKLHQVNVESELEQLGDVDGRDFAKHSCIVCAVLHLKKPIRGVSTFAEFKPSSSISIRGLIDVLRHSTQPAHVVVMVIVILMAMILIPRQASTTSSEPASSAWPLLYLCSFSFLFGAQMWMTFVSGLVLLFVLPRHTFARVQSALFPKYMLLSSIAAIGTLTAFVEMYSRAPKWTLQESYQVISLLICCLAPLVARLYVVPGLLAYIAAKVALERAAGHGAESGPKLDVFTTRSLNSCLSYGHVCRSFRRRHMFVAIVNMIVLACNVFHVYYLSSKICFL